MPILYDLIFLFIGLFHLPVYVWRRKFRDGFLVRLGFFVKDFSRERPIWVHAVSVGEVKAVAGLVEQLKAAYPGKRIVLSTVTATGQKIARSLAQENIFPTYLPLDFSFTVRRVLARVNPCIFIIAETEVWPNLITELFRRRIPIVTVNGRISDNSFRGYLKIKFLIQPILARVSFFCMQTERDALRLGRLGVDPEKIRVTGNMKFDIKIDLAEINQQAYRAKLGLVPENRLLVAGSTHPGEEEILLHVFRELLEEFPHLKLLLAPRHPERSRDVEKMAAAAGLRCVFVSSLPLACPTCVRGYPVFILDRVGELMSYYAIADVVYVGGSLVRKGGHNILEPAALGRPVLFGPSMFNFRDIADLFLTHQAAVLVADRESLKEGAARLLRQPEQGEALVACGRQLIQANRGATAENLRWIKKLLSGN